MSDSEYLEQQDWICNNPTKDEIRFNDDSDIISSDDSYAEQSNSVLLKNYNQLLPRGKSIHKLLHSTKPAFNKIWRAVGDTQDFLNQLTEDKIGFNHHSNDFRSDEYDNDEVHFRIPRENNQSKSTSKTVVKSLNSVRPKGNETWKTVNSKVDLQDPDSDLETVLSETMAKSHKRKREASASDEEEASGLEKIKSNENKPISKKVKRKENSHNVSASENEDSEGNSTRIQSKGHKSVNKPNRNVLNTHLLSSESDNGADLSYDFTSSNANSKKAASENGGVGDSEPESVENSEEEGNHVENTATVTSVTSESRNELHRTPKFTRELNEEVSKFSLLLDENLLEKNDIWLLQCPSDMDCSALVNQRLSLGGSCQLSDGERTYETYTYRNAHARSATIAVPSEHNKLNLRRIPISGNIIVEESVNAVNNRRNETILETPSRVEFPENLRVRHPLLGIDFSKQPRTAERIAESLPKKKKHSKKHGESYNGLTLSDMCSSSIPTPLKKKKKHKHRNNEDVTMSDHEGHLLEESVIDSAVKKKKKKKHKDNDSFN